MRCIRNLDIDQPGELKGVEGFGTYIVGEIMRELFFTFAVATALIGSAWADSWSHKGENWASSHGFHIAVPSVLKPQGRVGESDGYTGKTRC